MRNSNKMTALIALLVVALMVGVFSISNLNLGDFGKGEFRVATQRVQQLSPTLVKSDTRPTKALYNCMRAKGWIGTPSTSMVRKVDFYCSEYPSLLLKRTKPTIAECRYYKERAASVVNVSHFNTSDKQVLRAACSLLYPGDQVREEDNIVTVSLAEDTPASYELSSTSGAPQLVAKYDFESEDDTSFRVENVRLRINGDHQSITDVRLWDSPYTSFELLNRSTVEDGVFESDDSDEGFVLEEDFELYVKLRINPELVGEDDSISITLLGADLEAINIDTSEEAELEIEGSLTTGIMTIPSPVTASGVEVTLAEDSPVGEICSLLGPFDEFANFVAYSTNERSHTVRRYKFKLHGNYDMLEWVQVRYGEDGRTVSKPIDENGEVEFNNYVGTVSPGEPYDIKLRGWFTADEAFVGERLSVELIELEVGTGGTATIVEPNQTEELIVAPWDTMTELCS